MSGSIFISLPENELNYVSKTLLKQCEVQLNATVLSTYVGADYAKQPLICVYNIPMITADQSVKYFIQEKVVSLSHFMPQLT